MASGQRKPIPCNRQGLELQAIALESEKAWSLKKLSWKPWSVQWFHELLLPREGVPPSVGALDAFLASF